MDPVSAIGLASSLLGIIDVAARSISALRALQQRWKVADLTISLVISQLTTLKAALNQIKEWISTSLNSIQHYQLVMDLGASLESCETLLHFIDGQLSHLDFNDSNDLSIESKIKVALQDKAVKECATHLANQSTALNLLLTALNCRSMSEQSTLLQAEENRWVLDRVRDDSSSLLSLRDSASFRSSLTAATEQSHLLDISFDFDEELTSTKVYHRQWRPLIRGALRKGRKTKEGSEKSRKINNVRILAQGAPGHRGCTLPKVMSTLCGGIYDPELRRSHIYQVVFDTVDTTFEIMRELCLPSNNPGTETLPLFARCSQRPMNIAEMSGELGAALVALWDDPVVKWCYQDKVEGTAHPSATYFLDSIHRIASAGYIPTFEDAAMSLIVRNGHSDSLRLPVSMSSRHYSFVRWVPHGASLKMPHEPSRNMADECENLDAVLFMADCNTYFADSSLENEWDNTLQRFRLFCKFPWLAEKDIILVFLNIDKFPIEPLDGHALRHSKQNNYAETATRGDIINRFCSLNEDDSREIYAICAEMTQGPKIWTCLKMRCS